MSDEHEEAKPEGERTQRTVYQDERDDTIDRLGKMDSPDKKPDRLDEAGGADGSGSDPPAHEQG